jgi:hypothetical protein
LCPNNEGEWGTNTARIKVRVRVRVRVRLRLRVKMSEKKFAFGRSGCVEGRTFK